MKKVLALILTGLMLTGLLAGCGGTKEAESVAAEAESAVAELESALDEAAEEVADAPAAEGAHYRIATDKGFSPFEFEDEQGNIVGIDMDLLAAVAEDQGFTYDLQYIGWDAAIAACQSGQADGMIAGASITDERKENGWIFSDGYYTATQGMAVAKGSDIASLEDLEGKTVAVKNGTMSQQYVESIKDEYGIANISSLSTSADIYQAVISGTADACFDDTPIMKYSIVSGDLDMQFVDGSENSPAEYGFAIFNADNQDLIDAFNAGLANLKANGKYDEIVAKYLG